MLSNLIWAIPFKRLRWHLLAKTRRLPPRSAMVKRINKRYEKVFGRKLDLQNPLSWSEKIQWLKLNYHNPDMVVAADKYAVRKFVESLGLGKLLVRSLGVFEKASDIDFGLLPNQFVLKVNHDSGGVIVVRDKNKIDELSICDELQRRLDTPYIHGLRGGEWHYLFIRPCIVAEEYLGYLDTSALDYRIQCFNGEPRIIMVSGLIDGERYQSLYDLEWNELDASLKWRRFPFPVKRPDCWPESSRSQKDRVL